MSDPLTLDDLGWLLGVTQASIRRRQKSMRKQEERPFADPKQQARIMQSKSGGLGRARTVELRLIALLRAAGRDDLIDPSS